MIDQRQANMGWEPILPHDPKSLHPGGVIEEFPANEGPVDYLLFHLGNLIAIVEAKKQIMGLQGGVIRQGLNFSQIRSIKIPILSSEVQKKIVKNLNSILNQVRVERSAGVQIPKIMRSFRQSVLATDFHRELTERDPDEEPASALLEHIRAECRQRCEKSLRAKGKDPALPNTAGLPELPEGRVWVSRGDLLDLIKIVHSFKAQSWPAEEGDFGVIRSVLLLVENSYPRRIKRCSQSQILVTLPLYKRAIYRFREPILLNWLVQL